MNNILITLILIGVYSSVVLLASSEDGIDNKVEDIKKSMYEEYNSVFNIMEIKNEDNIK